MPCGHCDETGHDKRSCPELACGQCGSFDHVRKSCPDYKEHRRKINRVAHMSDSSIEKQNERTKRKKKPDDDLVDENAQRKTT
jgi:hypothetical protein